MIPVPTETTARRDTSIGAHRDGDGYLRVHKSLSVRRDGLVLSTNASRSSQE